MGLRTVVSSVNQPARVRAVLTDAEDRLVLIRRDRPGRDRYWVLPGGGVETADADPVEALRRELREELGAEVEIGERMLVIPASGGEQWIYRARLLFMDLRRRSGPEFDDPTRGAYTVEHVAPADLPSRNLLPAEAKALLSGIPR